MKKILVVAFILGMSACKCVSSFYLIIKYS